MISNVKTFSTNSLDMTFTVSAFIIDMMLRTGALIVLFLNVDSLIRTLFDLPKL